MKNDQKNETNPNMPSYLSHASSMMNMEPSPLIHLSDRCLTPGKYSRYFPAPSVALSFALDRSGLACSHAMFCDCFYCRVFICFLPLFSSIDPETDDDPMIVYLVEDPLMTAKQPGKQPPLEHAYIAYSFSPCLH
jgi:hypothetical protein